MHDLCDDYLEVAINVEDVKGKGKCDVNNAKQFKQAGVAAEVACQCIIRLTITC